MENMRHKRLTHKAFRNNWFKKKGYADIFRFANDVMHDKERNKGEQRHHYNLLQRKRGKFKILNDISEHVNLVQLIDTVWNVNHAVSIFRC